MNLPVLDLAQYQTVYNSLSFVIASFLGALVYFVLSRHEVSPKYRSAVTISAVIMVIAGYHYFRIFNSWEAAYSSTDHVYHPTGLFFDASYRYIDWLLTVPLLAAELIIGTASDRERTPGKFAAHTVAAGLMIVFGLIGDLSNDQMWRTVWAVASTIPFIYLLASLWTMIGRNLNHLPASVRGCASNLRFLLVFTWGVYPIVYAFPNWGLTDAKWVVIEQVSFCAADVLAKALFSLMIHWVAAARSKAEGYQSLA